MEVLFKFSDLKQLLQEERTQIIKEVASIVGNERPNKNLNAKAAADFLGISISTLYKSLHRIPHKRFGKKLLFSYKELEAIRH
jgi:transcriptional regulator of acetoin/glycerol metabolism